MDHTSGFFKKSPVPEAGILLVKKNKDMLKNFNDGKGIVIDFIKEDTYEFAGKKHKGDRWVMHFGKGFLSYDPEKKEWEMQLGPHSSGNFVSQKGTVKELFDWAETFKSSFTPSKKKACISDLIRQAASSIDKEDADKWLSEEKKEYDSAKTLEKKVDDIHSMVRKLVDESEKDIEFSKSKIKELSK